MNLKLSYHNTLLVVGLSFVLIVIQMVNYYFVRVQDGILPLGNAIFGLAVYGFLAKYYYDNNLWNKLTQNPTVLLYCCYVLISFVYGFWRFRTPTTSVFDLWLFIFIPAVLLIPAFSFDVRSFDKILAIGVLFSVISMSLAVAILPQVLYDRILFGFYMAPLAHIGAGSAYLLLKYAMRVNFYTAIGLFGVVCDAVVYGVGGAFRGRLILSLLLVLLFVFILLSSNRVGFGFKLLTLSLSLITCVAAAYFVSTRFEEQLFSVMARLEGIQQAYEHTGDLVASDARLLEFRYFMELNPSWKLILGHGVGSLWYDFYGMYSAESEGTFAGARTMLHMNWLHITFKIGIVGMVLMLAMLISHYRKQRVFLSRNWGWWAFVVYYCAWTIYYGDKVLDVRAIIFLLVLIHPWLFRLAPLPKSARSVDVNLLED